jgi:hypothetical protein
MRTQALIAALCLPATALAQDGGVEDVPQVNPTTVVMAARGEAVTVFSDARRHRGPEAYERALRLPLVRHRCYELLGHAVGTHPTFAQVMVGRAHVGGSLALTNAVARVARQRFCVTQPAELYTVELRAEGPAWWYLAVVERGEAPPEGPRAARTTEGPAPAAREGVRVSLEQHVIGGEDGDYIARQIQGFARQRPGVTGFTPVTRRQLPTNGFYEGAMVIPSGRCVDVVAVGVPSVADLVVELEDPSGHRVAQDAARRAIESIRYCAPYAGTYRLRVRVFSGAGLVGVQTLLEP